MLAVSRGHPLARRRLVRFADAIPYDFVGLGPASAMHSFISRIADEHGWDLKIRIHVGNYDAMCRMIASKVGIGLLAESAARRHARTNGIHILKLADDWSIQPLKICVRDLRGLPGLARQHVDYLVEGAARQTAAPDNAKHD